MRIDPTGARRRLARVAAAACLTGAALLAFGAMSGSAATRSPRTITLTVGYIPAVTAGGVAAIGEHFGWFQKAGLDIKWVPFTSGPAQASAMAGGSLDIEYLGGPAIWTAAKGIGKIVALSDLSLDVYILANPNSGIKTTAQLKGQRVGYTQGSASNMLLIQALGQAHMSFNDIQGVPMAPPTAVSAFLGGQIPAVAVFAPFAGTILQQAPSTVIVRTSHNFANAPMPGVFAASDNILKSNPAAVRAFLAVATRAIDYRATHAAATVNDVASFANIDPGPLAEQYKLEYWPRPAAILHGYQKGWMAGWVRNMETLEVQMGALDKVQPPSSFMDLSLDTAVLKAWVKAHPQVATKKKK